jgi:hypothetical protein
VGVALGLLNLERGLDVGAREILLPDERRREVAVLLARQRAEHRHERELVVEVVNPVVAGADGHLHGGGAELLDASESVLNARCNGGECLVGALDDAEELVVPREAHAGHLLDVHEL